MDICDAPKKVWMVVWQWFDIIWDGLALLGTTVQADLAASQIFNVFCDGKPNHNHDPLFVKGFTQKVKIECLCHYYWICHIIYPGDCIHLDFSECWVWFPAAHRSAPFVTMASPRAKWNAIWMLCSRTGCGFRLGDDWGGQSKIWPERLAVCLDKIGQNADLIIWEANMGILPANFFHEMTRLSSTRNFQGSILRVWFKSVGPR